tara:strand:- start:4444 stop:4587 length:144 start_codon:yes stop_codon:yes gene_type:complete
MLARLARHIIPPAPARRITVLRVAAVISLTRNVGIITGVLTMPGLSS